MPRGRYERWVRSPEVIALLVQARQLRPGDEIIFKRDRGTQSHTGMRTGDRFVLQGLIRSHEAADIGKLSWWDDENQSTVVCGIVEPRAAVRHFIAQHNIPAWRRPSGT